MGLRINTNTTSIAAQRTLGNSTARQSDVLGKLSSGTRIVKAADDAAGLAISEKLKAQVRGLKQAERNANDGISMIQIAEGGMNEVSNVLVRLRELSVQAASDTIGDTERSFSNREYQNLKEEVSRIAQVTEYNGKKLLNGEGDKYDIQVGIGNKDHEDRIKYDASQSDTRSESLGIHDLSVTSKEGAQGSLAVLDSAIEKVSGQRANLGAIQNRLSSTITNLQVAHENLSAANSRIRDTDFAEATAENAKQSILSSSGASVLAQANSQGQAALKLIG